MNKEVKLTAMQMTTFEIIVVILSVPISKLNIKINAYLNITNKNVITNSKGMEMSICAFIFLNTKTDIQSTCLFSNCEHSL
jgi:hypothetical protein